MARVEKQKETLDDIKQVGQFLHTCGTILSHKVPVEH